MDEEKNKKKNKVIKSIALLGLFLMIFGISYALFKITLNGNKTNKITTGKFSLILTDKNGNEEIEGMGVNLEGSNAIPMGSVDAMNTIEPYEFNVVNNGNLPIDYKMYLEVPSTSDLPPSKIKYNLYRTDTGDVLSLTNLNYLEEINEETFITSEQGSVKYVEEVLDSRILGDAKIENRDNKKLYMIDLGIIGPGQVQKYSFKMWVTYEAGTEVSNRTFEGKILVDGNQTKDNAGYPVYTFKDSINTFISLYTDDSIHIHGFGILSKLFENYDAYQNVCSVKWVYKYLEDTSALDDVNRILRENDLDEYTSLKEIADFITSINSESSDLYEKYTEEVINSITEVLTEYITSDNIDELVCYDIKFSSIYIEDGFSSLHSEDNGNALISWKADNLYISRTVSLIGSNTFKGNNIKNIEFTDLNGSYNYVIKNELSIKANAFLNSFRLVSVTLPSYLTSIEESAFNNSPNADVIIKANKANVNSGNEVTLSGVKSVTWING